VRFAGCFVAVFTIFCICLVPARDTRAAEEPAPEVLARAAAERKASRNSWDEQTTFGDYLRVGRHDPKWDEFVREGFSLFTSMTRGEPTLNHNEARMAELLGKAIELGCVEQMLEFGRELFKRGNFKARLPMMLVDAHFRAASDSHRGNGGSSEPAHEYFRDPEVFEEIAAVFEEILKAHPDSIDDRCNCAENACWSRRWDIANRLFNEIGDRPYVGTFFDLQTYYLYESEAHFRVLQGGQRDPAEILATRDANVPKRFTASFVDSYLKLGHRDAKWDAPAENGLQLFVTGWVGNFPGTDWAGDELSIAAPALDEAIALGCNDTIVRYARALIEDVIIRPESPNDPVGPSGLIDLCESISADNRYTLFLRINTAVFGAHFASSTGDDLKPRVAPFLDRIAALLLLAVKDPMIDREALIDMARAIPSFAARLDPNRREAELEGVLKILADAGAPEAVLLGVRSGSAYNAAVEFLNANGGFDMNVEGAARNELSRLVSAGLDAQISAWAADPTLRDPPRFALQLCVYNRYSRPYTEDWYDRAMAASPEPLGGVAHVRDGDPTAAGEFSKCAAVVRAPLRRERSVGDALAADDRRGS